jgi:hypothetical protein
MRQFAEDNTMRDLRKGARLVKTDTYVVTRECRSGKWIMRNKTSIRVLGVSRKSKIDILLDPIITYELVEIVFALVEFAYILQVLLLPGQQRQIQQQQVK